MHSLCTKNDKRESCPSQEERKSQLEIDSALIMLGAKNVILPTDAFFINKVVCLLPLEEKKCVCSITVPKRICLLFL